MSHFLSPIRIIAGGRLTTNMTFTAGAAKRTWTATPQSTSEPVVSNIESNGDHVMLTKDWGAVVCCRVGMY